MDFWEASRAPVPSRWLPPLPPFAENTPRVQDALRALGAPGGPLDAEDPLHKGPIRLITNPELSPGNLDNPFNTAGTTFLGGGPVLSPLTAWRSSGTRATTRT